MKFVCECVFWFCLTYFLLLRASERATVIILENIYISSPGFWRCFLRPTLLLLLLLLHGSSIHCHYSLAHSLVITIYDRCCCCCARRSSHPRAHQRMRRANENKVIWFFFSHRIFVGPFYFFAVTRIIMNWSSPYSSFITRTWWSNRSDPTNRKKSFI